MLLKIHSSAWILMAGLLVTFSGCESPPVDQEYLQSDNYKRFDKVRKQEYSAQVNSRESLQVYLQELIKCPKGEELSLPLQFSENQLQNSGSECKQLGDAFNTSFGVQVLGYSQFKSTFIRWVLLENESVYKNFELLAVTHHDTILTGVQTVGMFKKNLSQNISTDIRVSQKGEFIYITSYADRSFKYPFEYENIIQSAYTIDSLGIINEYAAELGNQKSLQKYFEVFDTCELGTQFTAPFDMDKEKLLSAGGYCELTENRFSTNFIAQNIGYTSFADLRIRWIILKKESRSTNNQLYAAVYRKGKLIDYQQLGMFRNDVNENLSTAITVRENQDVLYINSFGNHSQKSLASYDDTTDAMFRVNATGIIKAGE